MSSSSTHSEKGPLEAAQKIVAELTGMTPDHQSLALKFAIETLGIKQSLPLPGTTPLAHPPQPQAYTPVSTDHSSDIKSFTEMKAPKSDRQFAAVVAYFYQFEAKPETRKESIDADTMKDAARLAGWPQVARWRMTLTNAKNAGYLDAAGHGRFKLSSVGENLVAITLPGTGSAATAKSAKKKSPKKSTRRKK